MSLLVIACLFVCVALSGATKAVLRDDPRLPKQGTKNWALLGGPKFSPRHSHATTVFKCPNAGPGVATTSSVSDNSTDPSCLWLTGGWSESHRTYQGDVFEHENSDVWWSSDGATWNQVTEIYGDFLQGVGNGDAKVGGYVTPWYSRYGHSLNALDADGDGSADVLVLAGGFSPVPSNDVWISNDGITWWFDGHAPWPKRAYHGASVKDGGKLWIMGGSPLMNDVWVGSLVEDTTRDVGYKLVWEQVLGEAPWTPRAGFCVVTQHLRADNTTQESYSERMFLIGGMAHSEEGTPEFDDGTRARNDVWTTSDGKHWEQVLPSSGMMSWGSRAFHSCQTWHSLDDKSRWVGSNLEDLEAEENGNRTLPRIFITGGGYLGTKGNNVVNSLEAYTDTWYSHDGAEWRRTNYEEGSIQKNNLYSTNEWTETFVEDTKIYRGKWGHTLEAFYVSNGLEDNESDSNEERMPSLFVIGGKLEGGSLSSDVFVSLPGIHCELDGTTCNGRGRCGPDTQGCICDKNFAGEYCA